LNYEAAELAKGDSVLFVYNPEEYASMDPSKSGLIAMINWKNGYAITCEGAWKNMEEKDGSFIISKTSFDGEKVQLAHENQIRSIAVENIQALLNYEAAELAAGDSVMFVYDPEEYASMDPSKSGLIAMINWKAGFALKHAGAWKNMTVDKDDDDWWTLENVCFNGEDVAIVSENRIRPIKVENINGFLANDFAELSAGDSLMFVFRPSMENRYNEKESGLQAIIDWKNGYAISCESVWKNMTEKEGDFVVEKAKFDGKDVQIVTGNQISQIKVENIQTLLNYEAAELAAGDSVMFIFNPDLASAYDETKSGLIAMINWKAGYAMFENGAWKNMIEDDGTFSTYTTVVVDGKNVQLAHENQIRPIAVENIQALLNYDAAEIAEGDSVMYVYDPEGYSQ
jgi:uncharacterized protein YoaH (UPF0181 family)